MFLELVENVLGHVLHGRQMSFFIHDVQCSQVHSAEQTYR